MHTSIDDIEQELVASLRGESPAFHDATDSLVGYLLTTVDGYSGRPTDGVLFEWENASTLRADGAGVVVLIDGQRVEPMRIRVVLDDGGAGLASADVWFGDVARGGAVYGSKAHRDLVKRILLDREEVEFEWGLHFCRTTNGWSRMAT